MCNFISWITVSHGGKPVDLYLDDAAVFDDPHGRQSLAGCQNNDFLGHGAIRKFWRLAVNEGESFEEPDFWLKSVQSDLPPDLAAKLRNFPKYWGRMLKAGCFLNNDLWYVISSNRAPLKLRKLFIDQLARQRNGHDELADILIERRIPKSIKQHAVRALLAESDRDALLDLIAEETYLPAAFRQKFWNKVRDQKVPRRKLWRIVACSKTPEKVVREALAELLTRGVSNATLVCTLTHTSGPNVRIVWNTLAKRKPSTRDLRYIIGWFSDDSGSPVCREAKRMLKARSRS